MFPKASLLSLALLAVGAFGQQVGTNTAENHPKLSVSKCSAGGSCATQQGSVVLDSNWRWLHSTSGFTNCYTGNTWDASLCPDNTACAQNCALDGADYSGTYGITTSGNALTLKFVTQAQQKNIGSRVYLMDSSDSKYQVFNLLNQEFTFDVDMSNLPCGLNGALYFVEMLPDGGLGGNNKAGAKYGTGYCDTQCPHDLKFIAGEANVEGWEPSTSDSNAGSGTSGSCCNEMDIWEANNNAAAYTPHVCRGTSSGQTRCSGTDCGDGDERYDGLCDKDGCDFNSFRMGDKNFLGPGKTVNTNSKFTVVTQFLTNNNSTSGTLTEIRRLYVQNGRVIQNSKTNIPGMDAFDSVTDDFCNAQKQAFGDTNSFEDRGGLAAMGSAFSRGMVLVMSLWDDHEAEMLWLDSNYPLDKDATTPGVARGTCSADSGDPQTVESQHASASVTFSNIKFGPIGSTFAH
ncbi:cellulose -beta-cellobiosidase precursor [Moniliophthora roreri MCA 2997]|uniref:Glucanase n=2 Tax=Moniliophthora roreri TaxID=221103 RepID=V2WZE7_MONRO|nr:cellulose -beta-cellobiosidase precursor [Moniliophthora roreri MCA 2997]KAI3615797.1 cellulose-beta-cellobiosidase precursor [Moniliophthora roreri]